MSFLHTVAAVDTILQKLGLGVGATCTLQICCNGTLRKQQHRAQNTSHHKKTLKLQKKHHAQPNAANSHTFPIKPEDHQVLGKYQVQRRAADPWFPGSQVHYWSVSHSACSLVPRKPRSHTSGSRTGSWQVDSRQDFQPPGPFPHARLQFRLGSQN